MEMRIIFIPSAFKHQISMDAIRHVFEHKVFDHPLEGDEEKNLLLGFDRSLNLLEILYNEIDDNTVKVFHAMKCRPEWRKYAEPQ
jgi:hypothetical protein